MKYIILFLLFYLKFFCNFENTLFANKKLIPNPRTYDHEPFMRDYIWKATKTLLSSFFKKINKKQDNKYYHEEQLGYFDRIFN